MYCGEYCKYLRLEENVGHVLQILQYFDMRHASAWVVLPDLMVHAPAPSKCLQLMSSPPAHSHCPAATTSGVMCVIPHLLFTMHCSGGLQAQSRLFAMQFIL